MILEGYLAHKYALTGVLPGRSAPVTPNTYNVDELTALTELWCNPSGKLSFQGGGLDMPGVDMTTDIDYTQGFILRSVDTGGSTVRSLRMYGTYSSVATLSGVKLMTLEAGEDDDWPGLPSWMSDILEDPEHDTFEVQFFPADKSIPVPHPFGDPGAGDDPGGGGGPELPFDAPRTFYIRRENPSIIEADFVGVVALLLEDLPNGRRQLVLKNNLGLPHACTVRNMGARPRLEDNLRPPSVGSDGSPYSG